MPVEFDEEKKFNNMYSSSVSGSVSDSGLTSWLIKKNIVKDEKGAKSFMTLVTILCFGLSIFLLFK